MNWIVGSKHHPALCAWPNVDMTDFLDQRSGLDVPFSERHGFRAPDAEITVREALQDLSRRPAAEVTGAIQHATAALECVAGAKAMSKDTLSDVVRPSGHHRHGQRHHRNRRPRWELRVMLGW